MVTIFLIQDTETKEYLSTYGTIGFRPSKLLALSFMTKDIAIDELRYMENSNHKDLLANRFIDIKEYITFN